MYFVNAEMFWLLLLIPVLFLFYIFTGGRQKRREERFMQPEMLSRLASGRNKARRRGRMIICLAALFFIIFALIGPLAGVKTQEVRQRGIDVVFALDVSDSMRAEDIKPSRYQYARRLTEKLAAKLRANQIALITFAGESFLECPLTLDMGAFKMLLAASEPGIISSGGSDISKAIDMATGVFSSVDNRGKLLIIISDGENLQGEYIEAAEKAAEQGIIIDCIGIGYQEGAPIPIRDENGRVISYKKDEKGDMVLSRMEPEVLKEIAHRAAGKFFLGDTFASEWRVIAEQIERMRKGDLKANIADRYENRYGYFLFVAFLLLVFDAFWPEAHRNKA